MQYTLRGNINNAKPYTLDKTLKVDGAGADAKAVGDAIENLKDNEIKNVQTSADNAQASADNAMRAAETAQESADNAQTSANNAQASADNAKTAADNAQAKADELETTANMAFGMAKDALPLAGGRMTGFLDMDYHVLTNLPTPIGDDEAVPLYYLVSYTAGLHQVFSASLTEDGWTGVNAAYTQEVTVEGILETDTPHICPVYSEEVDKEMRAWACVIKAVAGENKITFTCHEKPKAKINIQIEVNR